MTAPTKKSHGIRAIAIIIVGLGLGTFFVGSVKEEWRAPTRSQWEKVKAGDDELAVRNILGEPVHSYERVTAPADYYFSGYGRKIRPISGKVLIYLKTDLILYVYLDQSGRVEETFVAGS